MTLTAEGAALTSLAGLTGLQRLRRLDVRGNAITNVDSLPALSPTWVDLRNNPLDAAALGIISGLCATNKWAITWDGGGCGSPCLFEDCMVQ
jgi:hypothetical protein